MRLHSRGAALVRVASIAAALLFPLACGDAGSDLDRGDSASQSSGSNTPPQIASVSFEPSAPSFGTPVRAVVDVSDPDGDPVKASYAWTLNGQPVGGDLPKLVLQEGSTGQELAVRVVVSDGRSESEAMIARVQLANHPPRIERLHVKSALEITAGHLIEVEAEVSDEDGDRVDLSYDWEVNERPASALSTGPSFATDSLQPGDVVRVRVRGDDGSDEGNRLMSPPIKVVNRPPRVVSQPGAVNPTIGFRYEVKAEDPDGDTPLLFVLEDAPTGMEIEAASGTLSWNPGPDQSGTHRVRVLVDDQRGGLVAHTFEVRVAGSSPAAAGSW